MAGNLATSPVRAPRRRPARSQPGPRDAGGSSSRRPTGRSGRSSTPPSRPRRRRRSWARTSWRFSPAAVGQPPLHHDRDDARGTHRAPARGDAGHRSAEPRGVARRPDALLRQRGIPLLRSASREAPRAICVPPTASRSIRAARARPSSSRSTRSTGSSSPAFRSTEAPSSRSSSRARSAWRPSRSRDRPSARTAGSRSPSPRPTRCSAASPSSTRSPPRSSAFP